MPRKTKEQIELEEKKEITKKPTKKATNTAKTKASTSKTTKSKKPVEFKTVKTKKTTASKKASTSKSTATKTTKAAKKTTTKKRTSKKSTKPKLEVLEYYDLPYRYNQTVVKVLAQTPTNLFIYWDISDKDRKNFEKNYGEDFFQNTKPVLMIYNNTLGYQFEVEINDFANSWYLHVSDSKCDYKIELGRRPIVKTEKINTDYIYITKSNKIESPNDHILFNKQQKMVYFRDIKTGKQSTKPLANVSLIKNMGKIYDIYDLYKEIYKDENIEEMNPTSNFK